MVSGWCALRSAKMIGRHIEIAICGIIALLEFAYCNKFHYCKCGHLKHENRYEWANWMYDYISLAAVFAIAVISFRGNFKHAKVTFYVTLFIFLRSAVLTMPIEYDGALIILILSVTHIIQAIKSRVKLLGESSQ